MFTSVNKQAKQYNYRNMELYKNDDTVYDNSHLFLFLCLSSGEWHLEEMFQVKLLSDTDTLLYVWSDVFA